MSPNKDSFFFAKNTTAIMKGGSDFMLNKKTIKIIGLIATVMGMGATLATDWVNDKKMDDKIEEKIAEVIAQNAEKES